MFLGGALSNVFELSYVRNIPSDSAIGLDARASTPPSCPKPLRVRSPIVSAARSSRKAEQPGYSSNGSIAG